MQKNYLHVASNTHLRQYPFSILLPEFLDVSDITSRSLLRPEKKRYSRLSGECAIIITTGKKIDTIVCLVGARSLLRPEKKDTVVCLAGCAVVSVFGSGGKLAVFLLWQESFITT